MRMRADVFLPTGVIMQSDHLSEERRRRNVRTAWLLGAFVIFIAVSSVPFWKGLFQLAMGGAQ